MDVHESVLVAMSKEELGIRKGPWTKEEDLKLRDYITIHGEGNWNSLAHCTGLKRTGKSCRLRWFNYLRPNLRRGNITLEEQLIILQLHSSLGNQWSKIAQRLPGRTDNEIKNYWRTRVQKQAKQLKCDVDSKQFRDATRFLWMPRLVEQIQASSSEAFTAQPSPVCDQVIQNGFEAMLVDPKIKPNTSGPFLDSFEAQVSPFSGLNNVSVPESNWSSNFLDGKNYCPEYVPSPCDGHFPPGLNNHRSSELSDSWPTGADSLELLSDEDVPLLCRLLYDETV